MSESSHVRTCPRCGTSIPDGAPEGLCPKCLLEEVVATTASGVESGRAASPPPLQALKEAFRNLEILEFIGQGGMGFVFKARQSKLNRLVALKILPEAMARDPAFAERFAREGQLLARLGHPNVVTVHDFGQAGGYFYLLMEYVDGVNLRQAMRTNRFTPEQALEIVPSICAALQYAHEEGVLHRDIKPENILLDTKGRVKIADFGIAKLMRESEREGESDKEKPAVKDDLTQPGAAPGTPRYMAPEQIDTPSAVDHRADIYSLGVVFYEMLTGELPIGRFVPPSRKTLVDPRVDEVVARALETQRERRFQSAGEIKTRVEAITGTAAPTSKVSVQEIPPAAEGNPISLSRNSRTVLFFGLIALIGLMVNQIVPGVRFLVSQLWETSRSGPTQWTITVAGIAAIVWLGLQVWRRRSLLVAPIHIAATSTIGTDKTWLHLAWMGVLLCLTMQVFWILFSQVSMLAQVAQAAVANTGLLGSYDAFSRALRGTGSLILYSLVTILVPLLLTVVLVRRELQRSDLVSPTPPPAWAPRAILICVAFSLITSLPVKGDASVVVIGNGGFVAVTALALFTFSRIWRAIAFGFLFDLLIVGVIGLLNFAVVASAGQMPIEWTQTLVIWGTIVQLANLLCLSAAVAILLLPSARAAFGLRQSGSRI